MNLNRIIAAGGISLVLTFTPALRAQDKPQVKITIDKKELLTDNGDKPEVKVVKPQAEKKPEKKASSAKISPEAQAELNQITAAYKKLSSLELAGTYSADLSAGSDIEKQSSSFTGVFTAPNKFRHEMAGDIVIGSTGEKLYAFRPQRNDYKTADAPKDRISAEKLPNPMRDILQMQNTALMCAIVDDAGKFLADGVKEISRASDVTLGDKTYTALNFKADKMSYRVLVDPGTHLLRQVVVDMRKSIEAAGRPDVHNATMTLDYTTVHPDAKTSNKQFAWAAPEGSKDSATADAEAGDAVALVGKDAPDFKLNGMDGKPVSMSDQKGSVVVLDFWATWCGPCRASLPGLNKIYKELQGKGFKAFAVDLEESKEKIQPVKAQLIPDIPVLLDEKSEVAKQYGVSGIPQTVVIGKDGKVKKVFIGSGNEANIRRAVEGALAE
jgi:cytochrome c biogenesis protein CcmG/thiol:disulfide interchange protein DsbE